MENELAMPAKRKKLASGAKVRLKTGATIPEVPLVDANQWTGIVIEAKGRGDALQYIVEWDEETEQRMPADFINACEKTGLFYKMACLPHQDVEACE